MCYGWGGGWRPTLGEWTWCHCWVPLQGAIVVCLWWGKWRVTTNFGGVDVPLQGAHGTLHSNGIQEKHPEKLLELLADVTLFPTLMTRKLAFAIWGLCWYIFFFRWMLDLGGSMMYCQVGPMGCLEWLFLYLWRWALETIFPVIWISMGKPWYEQISNLNRQQAFILKLSTWHLIHISWSLSGGTMRRNRQVQAWISTWPEVLTCQDGWWNNSMDFRHLYHWFLLFYVVISQVWHRILNRCSWKIRWLGIPMSSFCFAHTEW